MIFTVRYGGKGKVEKDGKELTIAIPPDIVLSHTGPFIEVAITHPRIVQEELKSKAKAAPIVNVKALIDSGASNTVISPRVANELGLVHTGFQKVFSVQDEQKQPVYFGFIMFPWGSGKEIPIVSCPLRNFDCIVGRDIIRHWHLSYNGPDGSIVICD